ncbi:hypothetical protein KFE98_21660 [bacterium SCSIO 12741]|nr:hypothetical protein KFE98_21660 [bacterium SCSIO 12741]
MNREYRLKICRKCQNRGFSMEHGVICKLTSKPADFGSTCPLYKLDEEALIKNRIEDIRRAEAEVQEESLGMSAIGIKSRKGAGCFIMIVAGGFSVFTILTLEVISIWVSVLFVVGVITFIMGVLKERQKKAENRNVDSAIDDMLKDEEGHD